MAEDRPHQHDQAQDDQPQDGVSYVRIHEFLNFPRVLPFLTKRPLIFKDVTKRPNDSSFRRNLADPEPEACPAARSTRILRRRTEVPSPQDLIPPTKNRPELAAPRGYAPALEQLLELPLSAMAGRTIAVTSPPAAEYQSLRNLPEV